MKRTLLILAALFVSASVFSQGNYKEKAFGVDIPMIYVQGGEFTMGGTNEQGKEVGKDELIHKVKVSDFYIGQFEITQEQWEAVMETTIYQQGKKVDKKLTKDKYKGVGPDYPMYYVSWEEAMEFCRVLSKKTGKKYSLPTEAEWEFAARGGVKADSRSRSRYAGSNMADKVAWHDRGSTHPVGTKQSNELDIYDMSGNVWEWCYDWYGAYNKSDKVDPEGPRSGQEKVLRGGSYHNPASRCRVAYRGHNSPERRANYRGFRIVCHDVVSSDDGDSDDYDSNDSDDDDDESYDDDDE